MSTDAIVLVDCASTLAAAQRAGWVGQRGTTVVASTKYGVQACHQAAVPHVLIDSFFEFDELIAYTLGTFDRLGAFCDSCDRQLWQWHAELRNRIRPFRYAYYELKILVDTISTKVFQLRRLLANAGAVRLLYRADPDQRRAVDGWVFDERRNLFGELLEATGAVGCPGVTLEVMTVAASSEVPTPPNRSLRASARQAVGSLVRAIARSVLPRSRREFVLFTPGGHDIKYLMSAMCRRGLTPVDIPTDGRVARGSREAFAQTWRQLMGDDAFTGFFSCEGVSYFSLVHSQLERLVAELTPAAVEAYETTSAFLRRSRVARFALTAHMTCSLEERSRMRACQDAGIRIATYQEGAGFGSVVHPINDYMEMVEGDDLLCYGTGNLQYRDALVAAGHPAKRCHVVGSAEQDAIRARIPARDFPSRIRSVMYASTFAASNHQHLPYNASTDTVTAAIQLAIFGALDRLAVSVNVRIKPHPCDAFPPRHYRGPDRPPVEVLSGPIEGHLGDTDLFIVDFPSTTLLTCLQTRAHVFVLADPRMTKFTDVQLQSLEKRAFVFFDVASLVGAIDRLADDAFNVPEIRSDDEYSRLYAVYLADGQSAERAAALLDSWDNA